MFVAAVLSMIVLKKRYNRRQWTALTIIVIGVAIVGASPIIFPAEAGSVSTSSNPVLGLILILTGQLFSGFIMVSEEKLFRVYHIHPLQMVGWEGFWGVCIYSVILLILQFTPCPSRDF